MSKKNPIPLKREDIRLAWVDLEMSGLDPDSDVILEAAFVITDADFNILAESPSWTIRPPEGVLENMDKWNTRTHRNSGLIDRCRESDMDNDAAAREALKFLRKHVEHGRSPMCGNSVCQDRRFMARLMPKLEQFFHYRNLDVSALKIISQMHNPKLAAMKGEGGESAHRALDDIRESIEEMRLYLSRMIVPADDLPGDYAEVARKRELAATKKQRRLQKKEARVAAKKARRAANALKRAATAASAEKERGEGGEGREGRE